MSFPQRPSSSLDGSDQLSTDGPATSSSTSQYSSTAVSTTISSTSTNGLSHTSTTSAASSSNTSPLSNSNSSSSGSDRTTVIVLGTVLSLVGCLLIVGTVYLCFKCRKRRARLFNRGITPIADEEIESWKGNRHEKDLEDGEGPAATPGSKSHQKHESVGSTKKPASVIIYANARRSEEQSPRSPPIHPQHGKMSLDGGKMSLDKELPFPPIQARAPNAREGLTDEALPGDDPYLPGPKRRTSRLSKMPRHPRHAHTRNHSSRSSFSLHNMGDGYAGYDSETEMTTRASHDYHPGHSRMISASSKLPRHSLSEEWPSSGGLSPRPAVRREDIGRAIG